MNKEYLTDLMHLIDISKTEVYINVSGCFGYTHPVEGMKIFCILLDYIEKHISDYWKYEKIDRNIFSSLVRKINSNKDKLQENDRYICYANKKLKEDKGWNEDVHVSVGLPKSAFIVILEELIVLYTVIELLEEDYCMITKNYTIMWSITNHFEYMRDIKEMLEKRLASAMINTYSRRQYEPNIKD